MKQPTKPAPTPAILAMLHVAQSAGLSALVSLLVATTQYLSTGNLNWNTLFTVLGGGFLTGLTMLWKTVSTNPNAAQAALDTANLALQRVEQAAPWLATDLQKWQRQASPPAVTAQPTALMPAMQSQTSGGGYPQQGGQQSPFIQSGLGYSDMNRSLERRGG